MVTERSPTACGEQQVVHDGAIRTKNYRQFIIQEALADDRLKKGGRGKYSGTIEYLIGGCTTLGTTDYTERHILGCSVLKCQRN
jgi:hypothetical protein